jgi:mannitol-1-phosphate 5-dehydrogenase
LNYINKNKLVLFGAGKIGRSFIGQLFSCGGYEVVFIDTFKPIIDELNLRGKYKVIIKSDKDEILWIHNVRGVFAGNEQEAGRLTKRIIKYVSVNLSNFIVPGFDKW